MRIEIKMEMKMEQSLRSRANLQHKVHTTQ